MHASRIVQRVSHAAVRVADTTVGEVGPGLLVLVGVADGDDEAAAARLAGKVARLRIFSDETGRFDRSVVDVSGEVLVVSQFTLIADSGGKGTRPELLRARPRPGCGALVAQLWRSCAATASTSRGTLRRPHGGRPRERRAGHDRGRCGSEPAIDRARPVAQRGPAPPANGATEGSAAAQMRRRDAARIGSPHFTVRRDGARAAPLCFSRGQFHGGRHVHEGAGADGGDRADRRVRPARRRGARRRAALAEPILRLRRPARRGRRLRALRGGDAAARRLSRDWTVDVSSPGPARPLRRPQHFAAYTGRTVTIRTASAVAGKTRFRGAVVAADPGTVVVDVDGQALTIPVDAIVRGNLIDEDG